MIENVRDVTVISDPATALSTERAASASPPPATARRHWSPTASVRCLTPPRPPPPRSAAATAGCESCRTARPTCAAHRSENPPAVPPCASLRDVASRADELGRVRGRYTRACWNRPPIGLRGAPFSVLSGSLSTPSVPLNQGWRQRGHRAPHARRRQPMAHTVLDPAAAPNTPARRSTSPQATTQRPWPGNAQVPPARGRHVVARDPAQRH